MKTYNEICDELEKVKSNQSGVDEKITTVESEIDTLQEFAQQASEDFTELSTKVGGVTTTYDETTGEPESVDVPALTIGGQPLPTSNTSLYAHYVRLTSSTNPVYATIICNVSTAFTISDFYSTLNSLGYTSVQVPVSGCLYENNELIILTSFSIRNSSSINLKGVKVDGTDYTNFGYVLSAGFYDTVVQIS